MSNVSKSLPHPPQLSHLPSPPLFLSSSYTPHKGIQPSAHFPPTSYPSPTPWFYLSMFPFKPLFQFLTWVLSLPLFPLLIQNWRHALLCGLHHHSNQETEKILDHLWKIILNRSIKKICGNIKAAGELTNYICKYFSTCAHRPKYSSVKIIKTHSKYYIQGTETLPVS